MLDHLVGVISVVAMLLGVLGILVVAFNWADYKVEYDDLKILVISGGLVIFGAFGIGRAAKNAMAVGVANGDYNEEHCTVVVEGKAYRPRHVSIDRGTGEMTLPDGKVIRFLGGTIEDCR